MFLEEGGSCPTNMALPLVGTALQPSSCWMVLSRSHRYDGSLRWDVDEDDARNHDEEEDEGVRLPH